jgi:tellurite resistance protein
LSLLFASRPIPLASFSSVMGIAGLGLAWRLAAKAQHAPAFVGDWIVAAGAALFLALLVVWLRRIYTHPHELRTESNVAISQSYFGAIVISVSLFAAAAVPYSRPLAFTLWLVAAGGGAALLIYLLGRWIEHGIEKYELTPAIFIPVVGNATSVYAAVPLGLGEFGWASFSFALLCWLSLGPLVVYRLLAVEPRLPRKLAPQIAVLVSSPAVLAASWYTLTGSADAVFKILTFKALFFALLTVRLWKMGWGEPYNVAMWGWTFPAAALAGVLERAAFAFASPVYQVLAGVALTFATLAVAACSLATAAGLLRHDAVEPARAS